MADVFSVEHETRSNSLENRCDAIPLPTGDIRQLHLVVCGPSALRALGLIRFRGLERSGIPGRELLRGHKGVTGCHRWAAGTESRRSDCSGIPRCLRKGSNAKLRVLRFEGLD